MKEAKKLYIYIYIILLLLLLYAEDVDGLLNIPSQCKIPQVVPDNQHGALYSTHSFKILFKEGGCGTFVPLFMNLISSVRQYNQQAVHPSATEARPRVDPLQAAQTPVDEMMRHA